MDYSDLKSLKANELERVLGEERTKLHDIRLKLAVNQVKNVREVRNIKRTIARIMMLLSQKQTAK